MEQIINEALAMLLAVGVTIMGLLLVQPLRPERTTVTLLRKVTATWLWIYAFAVLFLQTLRPPFSQSIALLAGAGVFWLLDLVLYKEQTQRRSSDARFE
jgi:surface polysaccharide O-acyltransferase-like enzyme